MSGEKKCPQCQQVKALEEGFYRSQGRKDGYASWCKLCTCEQRKYQKAGQKKDEYRVVAEAARKGEKPTTCPSCQATDVPSHKMRGRVEGDKVLWECFTCRSAAVAASKRVEWGCGWCDEEALVPPSQANREFCGETCREEAREARKRRKAREAQEAIEVQEAQEEPMADVMELPKDPLPRIAPARPQAASGPIAELVRWTVAS